jgi:hypothetical protein
METPGAPRRPVRHRVEHDEQVVVRVRGHLDLRVSGVDVTATPAGQTRKIEWEPGVTMETVGESQSSSIYHGRSRASARRRTTTRALSSFTITSMSSNTRSEPAYTRRRWVSLSCRPTDIIRAHAPRCCIDRKDERTTEREEPNSTERPSHIRSRHLQCRARACGPCLTHRQKSWKKADHRVPSLAPVLDRRRQPAAITTAG